MRQKRNKTKQNETAFLFSILDISAVLKTTTTKKQKKGKKKQQHTHNTTTRELSKETTTETTLLTLKVKLLIIYCPLLCGGEKGKFKLTHRTDPEDQVFSKDA